MQLTVISTGLVCFHLRFNYWKKLIKMNPFQNNFQGTDGRLEVQSLKGPHGQGRLSRVVGGTGQGGRAHSAGLGLRAAVTAAERGRDSGRGFAQSILFNPHGDPLK